MTLSPLAQALRTLADETAELRTASLRGSLEHLEVGLENTLEAEHVTSRRVHFCLRQAT